MSGRDKTMGKKGDATKAAIRNTALHLFIRKGFKDVTMKDICEAAGLSRGGLYMHYGSTGQISVSYTHLSYPQIAFPSFRRSWMKDKTLLLTLYTELNNRSYSGSISGPTFMHQEMS